MKTILLLILLVITFRLPGYTQNQYFSNAPVWQFTSACQAGFPCIENKNYIYYVNGDTLINNMTYVKLFTRGSGFYSLSGPPPSPCSGYFSFNDTINPAALLRDSLQKIFIYTQNGEELLYDFSLSVGDTIPATSVTYEAVVTSVDSIQVSSFYRKRIHFNDQTGIPYLIIEGIGHPNGFLEPVYPILECGRDLVCFGYNDSSYYPVAGMDCNFIASANELRMEKIYMYPNPAADFLYIKNIHAEDFSIIDPAGRIYKVPARYSDSMLEIETGQLKPGIYFISFLKEDGIVTSRFIRE